MRYCEDPLYPNPTDLFGNKEIPFHRKRINVLINELNLEMNRKD